MIHNNQSIWQDEEKKLTTEEVEKRGGSDGWGVGVVVARRNVCDYVPHGS